MKVVSGLCILVALILAGQVKAEVTAPDNSPVYGFKVKTIDGVDKSLSDYRGKVLLIVNTASHCGFTPQYAGLETLYERYKAKGFVILAFPENDFKNQEPGDNKTIKQFCELTYKVSFPLFSKIHVRGPDIAPLYRYLTTASGFNGNITWNFNKFLVDRHGRVIARFGSRTKPLDPLLGQDVLKALAQ